MRRGDPVLRLQTAGAFYRAGGVEASEYQVSYMTKIRFSQFSECESMKLTEMVFKRHGRLYNVSIFWNFV